MESSYLIQEKLEISNGNLNGNNGTKSTFLNKLIVSVIIASIGALVFVTYNDSFKSTVGMNSYSLSSSSNQFPFTLNRVGYEPAQFFMEGSPENMKYAILAESIAIIEPYADMYLYPKSNAYNSDDLYYYHYTLCSKGSHCLSSKYFPSDSANNVPLNIQCTPYDQYTLTVSAKSVDNKVLSTSKGTATCMYVRREIRDLTEDHLANTMEAMHELWAVNTEEGQKKYGESFISAKNLLEMHYFQASWRDTDHSHEGFGFLPHHIQMTNFFEASVQLVDPSITVPYWDYTRDSYPVTGKDVSHSYMFTNKTFGTISPPKRWKYSNGDKVTDGAITDSLWAYQVIEKNTRFTNMKTGYAYMRSPWSSNPSPYVSRFTYTEKELPTCANHLETFPVDTLQDYLDMIELDPHGNAHFTSGGVFGCDVLEPLVDEGVFATEHDSYEFCQIWF